MMNLTCGRGHEGALTGVESFVLDHLQRSGIEAMDRCVGYFHAKAARCAPCRTRALDAGAGEPGLAARYWHAFATIAGCHYGSAHTAALMMATFPELRGPHLAVERRLRELHDLEEVDLGRYVQVLASILDGLAPPHRRLALDRWSTLAASGEHDVMRALIGHFLYAPARLSRTPQQTA